MFVLTHLVAMLSMAGLINQLLWQEDTEIGAIFSQFGSKYNGKAIVELDYLKENFKNTPQNYFPESE